VLDLLLAKRGVDVNIGSKYNWTALMVACYGGHDNIVRRLLQVAGIDSTAEITGWTALHCIGLWTGTSPGVWSHTGSRKIGLEPGG